MRRSSHRCGFLVALVILLSSFSNGLAKDTAFKIVGYLSGGNFRKLDEIELNKLTHLNLAFANPNREGHLVFGRNVDVKPVVVRGHEAGLKVYVSLAGGGRPDRAVWKEVLQPANRSSFIRNILVFVEENNLDGVDVDIEWNLLPTLGELYTPFVIELKESLHARGKGITAALGATGLHEAVSQESLEAYDFINVMAYDKTGIWRPEDVGPHSPYSYAEDAIRYWTEKRRIAPERIVLGVPFYGYDFTAPARYVSFREIVEADPSCAYKDVVESKYYNGIPTIVRKTELAKKKVGGVMIWEISYDAPSELSLMRAVHQTVMAGDCEVKTFFRDEDGDGIGDPNKPFQACEAPKGYVEKKHDWPSRTAR